VINCGLQRARVGGGLTSATANSERVVIAAQGPGPIEEIWTPDASTISLLESALDAALQTAIDRAPESRRLKPVAADYYRQYAGFVVGGSASCISMVFTTRRVQVIGK
jgi:hypothetical protein